MALHAYTPPLHAVKTSQPHVLYVNVLLLLTRETLARLCATGNVIGGNAKLASLSQLCKSLTHFNPGLFTAGRQHDNECDISQLKSKILCHK